jgi:hypothetical protein
MPSGAPPLNACATPSRRAAGPLSFLLLADGTTRVGYAPRDETGLSTVIVHVQDRERA